jgi:hypothetical protein
VNSSTATKTLARAREWVSARTICVLVLMLLALSVLTGAQAHPPAPADQGAPTSVSFELRVMDLAFVGIAELLRRILDRLSKLEESSAQVTVALNGYQGKGGLISEQGQLRKRVHWLGGTALQNIVGRLVRVEERLDIEDGPAMPPPPTAGDER